MNPRWALIFDFDGVIVDSEPMHEAGLRAGFERVGMTLSAQTNQQRLVGFADRDAYKAVCADFGRTPSDEEFAAISRDKWVFAQDAFARGKVPAFPGTLKLIKEATAAGVPIAICSGARRREIEHITRALDIESLMKCIISADDVTQSKPNPEPYLRTVAAMGIAAANCVTIEDTDKGVAAAKAAGVRAVAVGHTLPASRLTQADRFFASSADISLELLASLAMG
ncbi:MAG: HAD family phosphatase [Planctomycetota bacterium]|nr:HAD family phosphatase [Planctomycetota bacterium]